MQIIVKDYSSYQNQQLSTCLKIALSKYIYSLQNSAYNKLRSKNRYLVIILGSKVEFQCQTKIFNCLHCVWQDIQWMCCNSWPHFSSWHQLEKRAFTCMLLALLAADFDEICWFLLCSNAKETHGHSCYLPTCLRW